MSRPTWVAPQFQPGLAGFLRMLQGLQLNPRTLGTTDYPRRAPLDEVIALLDQCAGAVILGYPQITVSAGSIKGEPVVDQMLLPTEWNHIEAGLAYARDLPLLVIHHVGIDRGIFDRGAVSTFLYKRDLALPHWPLADDLQGAVATWKRDCLKRPFMQEPPRLEEEGTGQPVCPNCSSAGHRFLLHPVPREFVRMEGVSHECSHCGFKLAAE